MEAADPVVLVILVPNGYLSYRTTRQLASDEMRKWFNAREHWRKCPWWHRAYHTILAWGTYNTFAVNSVAEAAGKVTFAQWVVGAEHIMAMYAYEDGKTPSERLATAQEKIADAVTRPPPGEEWKDREP